jgi:serine/threonine protein kinase
VSEDTDGSSHARLVAGRYRMDGLIGRGGMGEVYHGWDERLDRPVAIKLLRSPLGPVPARPDSPEAAALLDALAHDQLRFLREIHTTAQLENPGIPAVYDTGVETLADGHELLYLVMQLLRGATLQAILDQADYETVGAEPSVEWAAAIAAQLAAVLVDVHRADVVHRDLKPSNVMLVDGGLVKVLDFGIAFLRGAGAPTRLTQVNQTVGTPPYMSPEQCMGHPVTAASDIYSLGCLFTELLTGDTPFHGSNDAAIRYRHLHADMPALRTRRAEIPSDLEALVAAMLSKGPQQRPTAEAVYATLLPFITAVAVPPGEAAGDGHRDPTRPFHKPLLAAPRRRAPGPVGDKLTDTEAAHLRIEVQELLDQERSTEAVLLIEDALDRVGDDPALSLDLRHQLAAALYYAGEYTRAAPLFASVGHEFLRILPPTHPLVLECAYYAGHAYAERSKANQALPQLRFYVQNIDPTAGPEEEAMYFESRYLIAQMYGVAGRHDEALEEFEAIRPLLATALGPESPQVHNLDRQISRLRSAS